MAKGLRFSITATDRTRQAFGNVNKNMKTTQGLQRSWNRGLNANRRAVQQFGFQMGDFATQIAGGQSAMLAFTQQGGQMLQFFGPAGAIAAALLAVFGSLAIAFQRSGKAMSDLTPIAGVLREEFAMLGALLGHVKEIAIDFANLLINNLDRILITATMVGAFFAGRWLAAFIAARVATMTLAGALVVLRGALIRTGIGAIIVLAGELIFRFTQLIKGAGSFGNAMVLIGKVVREAVSRMAEAWDVLKMKISAAWMGVQGRVMLTLQDMINSVVNFADRTVAHFAAAKEFISTAFINMAAAVAEGVRGAINAVLGGIDSLLQKATDGINGFIDGLNMIPGVDIAQVLAPSVGEIEPFFTAAGRTAREAFDEALAKTYVGTAGQGLGSRGGHLIATSEALTKMAEALQGQLGRPIQSLQDLRDALSAADAAGTDIDIRDWFTGGDGTGGSASEKLSDEAERIKKIFEDLKKTISGALASAFSSLVDRTKSLTDIVVGLLTTILDKITEIMLAPIWDTIADGIADAFKNVSNNFTGVSLPSNAGGGYTGNAPRSGGIDGKGGHLRIMHPQETIVDHHGATPATGGGMPPVAVHIHENATTGETRVKQSPGRIDVFLKRQMTDAMAGGGLDQIMLARFGLRPKPGSGGF